MSNKTMSYAAILANQTNALKSTGPRTDAGKAVSRFNATKHGFRSTDTSADENQEEVAAARERWVKSFLPDGEVASALVDLSFRHKRQLERVFAADEAAIAVRVEEARETMLGERTQFIDEAVSLFETDPFEAYPKLRVTHDGVEFMLNRLEQLDDAVQYGPWGRVRNIELLAMEGASSDQDDLLDLATRYFDTARESSRAIQTMRGVTDAESRLKFDAAVDLYEKLKPDLAKLTAAVRERIQTVVERLQEERIIAQVDEARWIRATIDLAKFDDSDTGRLRRRYISDAQRDFFKALNEARKACPTPKAQPVAPPAVEALDPVEEPSADQPSEPMIDYAEESEPIDPATPATEVRGRRTA